MEVTGPVRTCVGCRRRAARSALVRLVWDATAGPAGAVVVDRARVLPGRGASVHPDPACLEKALRRKAIGRALRVPAPSMDQVRAAWQAAGLDRPVPSPPTLGPRSAHAPVELGAGGEGA